MRSSAYLDRDAAAQLADRRQQMQESVEPRVGGIDFIDNEIRWYTFTGGRINSTLRYALSTLEPSWTITPDNYDPSEGRRLNGATLPICTMASERPRLLAGRISVGKQRDENR